MLDGAFSAAQAARGKAAYNQHCASCHHAELTGLQAPALKGAQFLDRWREFPMSVLIDTLQMEMPKGNPGGLPEPVYRDIATYIVEANGVQPGERELTAEDARVTLLVGPDGPKPLPSSAQVRVVGCLMEDSGNGFFFASANEPERTLDGFQVLPADVKDADGQRLGRQVFRLENLSDLPGFSTNGTLGFKAVVKGILVRQAKGDRINVTALKTLPQNCDTNRDDAK